MTENSTSNLTKIAEENISFNDNNSSEWSRGELCENLEIADDPDYPGRKNNEASEFSAQGTSMGTLTETPTNINQTHNNTSPSRMDINEITFQLYNNGKAICIPEPVVRRKLLNITATSIDDDDDEDGYDSDGNLGPFFDAVEDEEDIDKYVEDTLAPSSPEHQLHTPDTLPNQRINNDQQNINIDTNVTQNLTKENILSLKVSDLKDEL